MTLDQADARLRYWFDACAGGDIGVVDVVGVAVAFSGGIDSSVVAWYGRETLGRDRCTAYIADSPSLKRSDLELAQSFCRQFDIVLKIITGDEMSDDNYTSNPINRCYYCKSHLYASIHNSIHNSLGADAASVRVCSGANQDDMGDYRPGLEAAAEAQVHHPLLACGIGKKLIRALAKKHGLPNWNKQASPCMSSRIPYGQHVSVQKLQQIEQGEAFLLSEGFTINRVRHYDNYALIEVPTDSVGALEDKKQRVNDYFRTLGFNHIEIDSEGFVSGKLNRVHSSNS